jgi:hypothetical protein
LKEFEVIKATLASTLGSREKLILIALARRGTTFANCYPSLTEIERSTSFARSTAVAGLAELERLKVLTRSSGGADGKPNRYKISQRVLTTLEREKASSTPELEPSSTPELEPSSIPDKPSSTADKPSSTAELKEPIRTNEEPSKGKARPKSVQDVITYAVERGLPKSDGEAFFDAKEGNGWRNGKNPVKDWKATFRNWQANGWHPSQKSGGGKPAGDHGPRLKVLG